MPFFSVRSCHYQLSAQTCPRSDLHLKHCPVGFALCVAYFLFFFEALANFLIQFFLGLGKKYSLASFGFRVGLCDLQECIFFVRQNVFCILSSHLIVVSPRLQNSFSAPQVYIFFLSLLQFQSLQICLCRLI